MSKSVEILRIADIHATRITDVMRKLQYMFPISEEKVKALSDEELFMVDFLVNRFAKLQDYIGSKVIDLFFEVSGETTEGLTIIDKLHQLEKIGILEDAEIWLKMRKIRNHIAHEYPDHPELTAKYLNEAFVIAPQLLLLLKNLKARL